MSVNEFILRSGKKVQTKELTAYQHYNVPKFLTVSATDEHGNVSSGYLEQKVMVMAAFSVGTVNGESVNTPTDEKSFIKLLSKFTGDEFTEYVNLFNAEMSKRQSAEEGNEASSTSGDASAG